MSKMNKTLKTILEVSLFISGYIIFLPLYIIFTIIIKTPYNVIECFKDTEKAIGIIKQTWFN